MDYSDISTSISGQVSISNFLTYQSREEIIFEIINGLTSDQKYISSRFFYDDKGSSLFEDITRLPEYYPTRTEIAILKEISPKIAQSIGNTDIIELGSGDCSKISVLMDAISMENRKTVRYIPVDVSNAAILKSAEMLSQNYPEISIHGMLADFLQHLNVIPGNANRLICFFGSTLGNLSRKQANQFLLDLKELMNPGDQLLLGLDLVKDTRILENAYNDLQGITTAFNKNILNVVNQYIQTELAPEKFKHVAYYNVSKARIEMHLEALENMEITSPYISNIIQLKKGETIHTENSHKYTPEHIYHFSTTTGLQIKNIYSDANQWFSLVHFVA